MLAQAVLMLAVVLVVILDRHRFAPSPFQLVIALVFLAFSAVTGIGGVVALGKSRTAFPKPLAEAELVRHGIYRYIRHPLYSSMICFSLSWGLFWSSWIGLAGACIVAIFFDLKARREERWLEDRYPDYTRYKAQVRRFVPWIY